MKEVLKKSMILGAAAAMLAGMAACGPAVPFGPQGRVLTPNRVGAQSVRGGKKWTIMVHLAADNNLYSFGLEDVNEMEQGLGMNPAAAADVDVIVLFDGTPKGDSKILRIKPDPGALNTKIISEVIDDKGAVIPASKEVDTGDPVVAAKFVDFATKNFPAEKTAHVIWNHGSGIYRAHRGDSRSTNALGPVGSFFETVSGTGQRLPGNISKVFAADDHGGEMHLRDVQTFIGPANRNLGRPVDIVGFDACLMQHIETAYQYKGMANILVASEELEPGAGWNYAAFIGAAAKNPNITPPQLSKVMVDSYHDFYAATGDDATLSAVDINAVANVFVPALNDLANELKAGDKAAISAARGQTQTFYNSDAADLGDFLKHYQANSRNNPRVGAAVEKMTAAINQTLIAEGHTGSSVPNATGIQVYFPTATMSVNRLYDDASFLRFAETKGWSSFLHAFTGK
ncbi:MAG: clostripain-related cysteine peptidase [Candidatus Sericytochromatia bacterium]